MKIEIYLSELSLQNEVIQALSVAQLTDKVELNIVPSPSQQKSLQRKKPARSLSKISVDTCVVDRGANGKLWCRACGQTLPSTPEGGLDKDQLAHEIVTHQRWPGRI